MRRVWTRKGVRPVVTRQIKYEWDYLYGSLGVVSGEAHFAHLPSVSLEWDQRYLRDLAANDPDAIHVLVCDQAGIAFGFAFALRAACGRLSRSARLTFAMAIPDCPHRCASWIFLPTVRNSIPASSSRTSSRTRPATKSLQRYAPYERKWATRCAATGWMQNPSSA